ncbi:MAG: methyltransferase, TIGR04325 family [Acidobacteriota bacterium]
MSERLHRYLDQALEWPGVRAWRHRRFDAAFGRGRYDGVCRGVYASYQEAAAAAPKGLPLGYDHTGPASMYRNRLNRVWPSDYPMMLWLDKAWRQGARQVVDLGGHVGVAYYAYQRYIDYPPDLRWQILDVPAVMAQGRALAQERDTRHALSFVDDFSVASQADVLFTSGCLQYLEATLADKLAALSRRPPWLLVNLLPLHDEHAYWTVQNIGQAFCPYRIQRKDTFLGELDQLGYDICDIWENAEKRCEIKFAPQYSLDRYFGAALRLR